MSIYKSQTIFCDECTMFSFVWLGHGICVSIYKL